MYEHVCACHCIQSDYPGKGVYVYFCTHKHRFMCIFILCYLRHHVVPNWRPLVPGPQLCCLWLYQSYPSLDCCWGLCKCARPPKIALFPLPSPVSASAFENNLASFSSGRKTGLYSLAWPMHFPKFPWLPAKLFIKRLMGNGLTGRRGPCLGGLGPSLQVSGLNRYLSC